MMRKKTVCVAVVMLFGVLYNYLFPAVMPRPDYENSVVLSMTYSLMSDSTETEMAYMKSQFGGGLYAPLACSTFVGVEMDWHIDITGAGNNIGNFKDTVGALVQKAREYGVGLHLTLTYGISRKPQYYNPAKDEDIRNAQWYNDNNIMAENQWNKTAHRESNSGEWEFDHDKIDNYNNNRPAVPASSASHYALTTMSRCARKLRNHLEAKVEAACNYLNEVRQLYPDLLLVISAPGEAELNLHPVNNFGTLQEYFCDFSPFAVLEFRDWIRHEGLYAADGRYGGQGYVNGGARYQGSRGLRNFNDDFGTSFTTWDLKYFDWDLSDPVDTDYTDGTNPDPNIIPVNEYTFDGMMPTSGEHYVAGGFDPPRVMKEKGRDIFWDLWNLFREKIVAHFVKDMAAIARASGFPRDRYYTHQIPADYLFGTRPDDPAIPLNPRYYSSASPLWTADAYGDTGVGITMYDINFGTWYARTSQYILPVISSMSTNWGAMEYNPEIIPQGFGVEMAPAESIYEQFLRLYDHNVHFVSFFQWKDSMEHQFKDTNREEAARLFFHAVKDKARQSTDTVFTPKRVEGAAGSYYPGTGTINLSWSQKIWSDLDFNWDHWGDFKEFVIYRGYTGDFQTGPSSEVARVTGYSYNDRDFISTGVVYYKIAAVNVDGEKGSAVTVGVGTGAGGTPILSVSRSSINFGAVTGGTSTPSQSFQVGNTGTGILNWSIGKDAAWLNCTPMSGIEEGMVNVTVDVSGKAPGTYSGTVTVSDHNSENLSQAVRMTLTVYGPGGDAAPFGSFETPGHNTTVRSSVPFTGWVLDDIAVDSVKIYRKEGSGMAYIGDALLVEGARPDVESRFADYPDNSRAGWGYMMLTNFLPNHGNGTFTFYAVAEDVTGHTVTLGSKTVTVDNANAVEPFGAIDTPTQGGDASGTAFRNNGWVLTPMPNCIPTNGSTIGVYVDGVFLGNPVYNIARLDISSLFPDYCNSSGAHAYFDIDTTAFANGVHTIAWIAEDSAGNADGIGSRYFSIKNTQSAGRVGRRTADEGRKMEDGVVEFIKGYKTDGEPQKLYPDKDGNIRINIFELERLELRLPGLSSAYMTVNGQRRPLPVGSTLDAERGVFYWLPGPGFRGKYTFVFITGDKTGKPVSKYVTITIRPGSSRKDV